MIYGIEAIINQSARYVLNELDQKSVSTIHMTSHTKNKNIKKGWIIGSHMISPDGYPQPKQIMPIIKNELLLAHVFWVG